MEFLIECGADIEAKDRFGNTPLDEARRHGVRLGQDRIVELMEGLNAEKHPEKKKNKWEFLRDPFIWTVLIFQIIFGVLFALFMQYDSEADGTLARELGKENVTQLYGFYMDVHVMIFLGFGFLMTFLRKYGFTSVGLSFLLGCIAVQWYLLVGPFWEKVFHADFSEKIHISITQLIRADFAAGSVLIAFGALLGKVSSTQMLLLTFIQVFFFALNESISLYLKIEDLGGSMVIHLFGAYFGLAASFWMTPKAAMGHKENISVYHADLFSLIGTIFLWMYWPSFNAALGLGKSQHRAVINTVLAISSSCIAAFFASRFFRRSRVFHLVDIQNATLAGGVAIGAAAQMVVPPAVAILVGFVAGCVSVFGFAILQGRLERYLKVHDTCGVHNLHGMPAVIGAIVAVVASACATTEYGYSPEQLSEIFPAGRTAQGQALMQLAFWFISWGIALVSGLFTGLILRKVAPAKEKNLFLDVESFEVPDLEVPYYFDRRGEVVRDEKNKMEGKNTENSEEMSLKLRVLESRLKEIETGQKRKSAAVPAENSLGNSAGNQVMQFQMQAMMAKLDLLISTKKV